jgi:DNA-binding response OmpR family regulator
MNDPLARKRVLIVEDEVLVAMLVEELLERMGYEVTAFSSHLDEALRIGRAISVDFAILDINLNGKQSFPVADTLRERGLPFVFATGYGGRALESTYTGVPVLQKPFNLDDFRRTISAL